MLRVFLGAAVAGLLLQTGGTQAPDQYFGFHIGADGELARYPKIVEYLQHLSKTTNRVKFEERGKTTMGNPYVLATISAPENLAKLNRLVEINRRLADPRADRRGGKASRRKARLLFRLRHDPFDQSATPSRCRDRPPPRDRQQPPVQTDLDNVVILVPSQNRRAIPGRRPLVTKARFTHVPDHHK
jgi:hypothetical protein